MGSYSRRKFILSCSSGLAVGVLAAIDRTHAQGFTTAFWKARIPLNVRTTQFVAKAAILDASFKIRTTQFVAKAAVLDTSYKIQTTQFVIKVAVRP